MRFPRICWGHKARIADLEKKLARAEEIINKSPALSTIQDTLVLMDNLRAEAKKLHDERHSLILQCSALLHDFAKLRAMLAAGNQNETT